MPEDALHSVLLVALELATDSFGKLGGGSIVSQNRIITCAALVDKAEDVRIWFYRNDLTAENRLQSRQIWIQPNNRFEAITLLNDIAVITFKDIFFPTNIIKLVLENAPPATDALVVSYGFISSDSTTALSIPVASAHTIDGECLAALNATTTHFCATATQYVLCPGDQGSGIFTGTGINRRLVSSVL